MKKVPKGGRTGSPLVIGIKAILALELAAVGVCYYAYYKMNRSQEYRYKIYQKYPSIVNGYYIIGEHMGGLNTREEDYKQWGVPLDDKS